MTPERIRITCRFTALIVCLTASGCFVPGGGWTLRSGIDVRRSCKPAVFLEMVDSRWDEYSRIAEINAFSCPMDGGTVYSQGVPGGTPAGSQMPAGATPGSGTGLPPDSDNYRNPSAREPSALPGLTTEEIDPPGARSQPTARTPPVDGPRMALRGSDVEAAESGGRTVQVSGVKPAKRPLASRLFSRPQ
jgi:hypothetical protein